MARLSQAAIESAPPTSSFRERIQKAQPHENITQSGLSYCTIHKDQRPDVIYHTSSPQKQHTASIKGGLLIRFRAAEIDDGIDNLNGTYNDFEK